MVTVFIKFKVMWFGKMPWKNCKVYFDVTVTRKDFGEQLANLNEVFNRIKNAQQLNSKKCVLFQKKLKFIGHVIPAEGIETDPDTKLYKIDQNQSFVTLCIGDLLIYSAKLLHSLNSLSEKNKLFCWTPGCQQAFTPRFRKIK